MSEPVKQTIREVLLAEIRALESTCDLQQATVLQAAARKFQGYDQQAILTQWGELFRTGLLAWGLNFANPDPPRFHLTEQGAKVLENSTRDPSNPAGYLRHLNSIATLDQVAMSYLKEGLDCYAAGLYKAAAVMIGAAAESVILDLRNTTVKKLASLGGSVPKKMQDWQIKTVSNALTQLF